MRRFSESDFGLTWLASGFHADWRDIGDPAGVLDFMIWEGLDARAVMLVERDARLMLRMPTARDVEVLWNMATEAELLFGVEIASGFAWLEAVVAKCEERVAGKRAPNRRSAVSAVCLVGWATSLRRVLGVGGRVSGGDVRPRRPDRWGRAGGAGGGGRSPSASS